jgi:hypothetical protein
VDGFDPAALIAPFLSEHLRSFEALQRSFWKRLVARTEPPRKQERRGEEERKAR